MIKTSFLFITLSILCINSAIASDATKKSEVATSKVVVAQSRSALCDVSLMSNPQPKHIYDLQRLTQQLKRLPTVLTLKIIQLAEASKTCGIFSYNDADYKKNVDYCNEATKKLNYFDQKDIIRPFKGRESNEKNVRSLYMQLEPAVYNYFCRNQPVVLMLAKSLLSCFIEPKKLRVSTLNQKVMRSLLQPNKPASDATNVSLTTIQQQTLSITALSQSKNKRKHEDK